jgi:hypothetical protein
MIPAPARRRPHCAPGICSSRARLFFRRISGDTRPRTVSTILSCWRVIGAYGWRMMINAVRRIWTWCPRASSRQLRGIGAPRNSEFLVGWLKHMEHIDGSRRLPLPSLCLRGCVLSRAIGDDPQHWARLQPRQPRVIHTWQRRRSNPATPHVLREELLTRFCHLWPRSLDGRIGTEGIAATSHRALRLPWRAILDDDKLLASCWNILPTLACITFAGIPRPNLLEGFHVSLDVQWVRFYEAKM